MAMGFLVLLTSMTLNDPEPKKLEGFCKCFVILDSDTHFNSELRRSG